MSVVGFGMVLGLEFLMKAAGFEMCLEWFRKFPVIVLKQLSHLFVLHWCFSAYLASEALV